MNQIAPTSVEFHDVTLFVAIINGINYVAIKPISDALGLEWSAQFRRIKRHPVLNEAIAIMAIPSTGGEQEALALRLDKLNGWLFGISTNRVRPELRERLIQYQRECFDVLAQHFGTNNYGTPRIDPAELLLDGQSDLTIELPEHIQAALNARAGVLAGEAFVLIREHLRRRIAFGAV
ncbi:hypothetical protein D0850_17010, partial [Bordetella avium]|uniref:phage antirepressor N-terminal domain-containing protein n=1 Tax=Bordetella avium TaxID=521 RepID=UPI000EBBA161